MTRTGEGRVRTLPRGAVAWATVRAMSEPTRKEAVRDAALTLFAERGYHRTSINDIGASLNLRGPSLYNHIDSKHQLLVDIVTDFLHLGIAGQERILASTDDPVEQLRQMVDVHVSYNAADPRQSYVATREMSSLGEPDRTRVVALRDEYEHNLLEVLERGVAAGVFDLDNPQLAAYAILAMGIHVSAWFKAGGPLSGADVSREYQEFALRLVRARG